MSKTYDIKVDNVGPLSTTFTPPSTCLETTTVQNTNAYYVAAFWDDVPECYPPGTDTQYNFHTLPQYYSPGLCPKGWAPITSAGADYPITATDYAQWVIAPETQVWLCCPSGYSYWGFDQTAWYYTDSCQSSVGRGAHMTNLKSSGSSNVEPLVTITTKALVDAKGILIMWESTDTAIVEWAKTATAAAAAAVALTSSGTRSTSRRNVPFPISTTSIRSVSTDIPSKTSSAPDETTSTSIETSDDVSERTNTRSDITNAPSESTTGTVSSTATVPVSQIPSLNSSVSEGLSAGAKAGIGVGIAIGVLAFLLLGFLIGRRRRSSSSVAVTSPSYSVGKREDDVRPELATAANVHEVPTNYTYYELPANQRVTQLP